MLEIYMEDYYKGKLKNIDLADKLGLDRNYISIYLPKNNYTTFRGYLEKLNFKNNKLKSTLIKKYSGIINRCNGMSGDKYGHYNGMEYLDVIQWVNYCNQNKQLLESMWETYVISNKNLKYAISIDRIDDDKGYLLDNIQFVTHGFNSWKRDLKRPIKIEYENNIYYFMSCQEGSRYFNLRKQTIGEYYRGERKDNKFKVTDSTIEEVLRYANCNSVEEYYNKHIKQINN